ncbi:MAG: hypothetical protein Ta2B_07240 [Termitinemataceae bacterium]|nr:MAG: hypothetical protein Ta2B_07240 [Termitinemataceae bacterium]
MYCELAPCNQRFKLQVENAQTGKELKNILADLLDTGFISAFVLKKSIQENIKEYEALSLDEQRKFIFELIDKNMLYVASCDVEDKDYGLTEADISFTKSFYEDKL